VLQAYKNRMLLQCELPSFCSSHSGRKLCPGYFQVPTKHHCNTTALVATHTSLAVLSPPSPFSNSIIASPFSCFTFTSCGTSAIQLHTRLHSLQNLSLRKLHQAGPNGKLRSRSLARQPAPFTAKTRRHKLNSASILSRHRCIALPSFADWQHVFKGAGNSWVACWPCHQRRQCGPHH
jgi:hypothetical protein